MKSRKNEVDTVEKTKVGEEDLKRIKEYIESVRFGTVTVIVQDGKCEAGNCTCKTVC
ncbi:MAG: YezD family protein [Hominisplanchenecus sp.]|nr:YezD family protein [Lachnospiraceae bacterium]MDY2820652.1 YezD family protein [Hominisplanchenecus sp.]